MNHWNKKEQSIKRNLLKLKQKKVTTNEQLKISNWGGFLYQNEAKKKKMLKDEGWVQCYKYVTILEVKIYSAIDWFNKRAVEIKVKSSNNICI